MRTTLTLEVPADLEPALRGAGYSAERLVGEARCALAASLYARKTLSLEQAARLAGVSLWEFLPVLGAQGIPAADYDEDEARQEVEAARWLAARARD